MYDLRALLAIGLAVVLGLVLVVAPRAVIQLQWFMHGPTTGRHGEWGDDDGREFADTWLWLVRAIGVAVLAVGGFLVAQPHL